MGSAVGLSQRRKTYPYPNLTRSTKFHHGDRWSRFRIPILSLSRNRVAAAQVPTCRNTSCYHVVTHDVAMWPHQVVAIWPPKVFMWPRFSFIFEQTAVRHGGHVATHGRDHMAMWPPSSSAKCFAVPGLARGCSAVRRTYGVWGELWILVQDVRVRVRVCFEAPRNGRRTW